MRYTRDGDLVTLEMTQDDFETLLFFLGFAMGNMRDSEQFRNAVKFVNKLNTGNPNFTPYEEVQGEDAP